MFLRLQMSIASESSPVQIHDLACRDDAFPLRRPSRVKSIPGLSWNSSLDHTILRRSPLILLKPETVPPDTLN